MAHLNHKLPWNSLAARLELIRDRKDLTPRYTDLFSKPNSDKQLKHFLKALGDTIREFAITEHEKYPQILEATNDEILFSTQLFDTVLPFMMNKNLSTHGFCPIDLHDTVKMENWLLHAGPNPDPYDDNTYNEVISMLLVENQMEPLLKLAKHPRVRLDKLGQCPGHYQFGFDETIASALQAYVCFNLIYCKTDIWATEHKLYRELRSYQSVMLQQDSWFAGDLVYLLYRKHYGLPWEQTLGPFDDLDRLQEYLKACFQVLVRFDMMEREAGRTPDWTEIYAWSVGPSHMHKENMFSFGHTFNHVRSIFTDRTQEGPID